MNTRSEQTAAVERVADVAAHYRQRLRRDPEGWPYLDAGRVRIEGDGGLIAVVSAHEGRLIRRLSGVPGVRAAHRLGEEIHFQIRPDSVGLLARLGRLD